MPLYNPPTGSGVADGATLATGLTFPNTGLHILDTNASHDLILAPGSNITADRTLTITTGDSDRTLTINGNTTLNGTNTGDQTSIVGISGTKAEFDTACTDGNFAYQSDLANYQPLDTQLTDLAGLSYASATSGSGTKYLRVNATNNGWEFGAPAGTGDVTAAANITDNRIVRGDGGAKGVQESAVIISDNGEILLAAGGTADAPLKFQAGTNLSTPEAGADEYDGSLFYRTNVANQRGLSPSILFTHCGSDFTLSAASGVQAAFAAAQDTITLEASSTYFFEAMYILNTGSTTHTTATAFGGTATVNSCEYIALLWNAAANTIATAQSTTHVSGVASKVLNATSTAVYTIIQLTGTISINAAGTLIPQINFSANPTGTNLMKRGSYIRFTKIGGAAPTSIGNWA